MRSPAPCRRGFGGGFTLIELLVVVALIAFLSVAMGLAWRGGEDASRLAAGETALAGYVQLARGQAALHRQPVRVLVLADPARRDRHLRWIGAVRRDPADPARWSAVDDGILLAEGVFFWPAETGLRLGEMRLDYPRAAPVAEGGGGSWLYWEIGTNGTLSAGGSLVLARARWAPGEAAPAFGEVEHWGGFLLSRSGAVHRPGRPEDLR